MPINMIITPKNYHAQLSHLHNSTNEHKTVAFTSQKDKNAEVILNMQEQLCDNM